MRTRKSKYVALSIAVMVVCGYLVWKCLLGSGFIGEFKVKRGSWMTKTSSSSINDGDSAASINPTVNSLRKEFQGKQREGVRAAIIRRLGPPARNVGSGLQIEEWDVDGGTLILHPLNGPTFQKDGVRTRLLRTTNLVKECVSGSYQMTTKPEGRYSMRHWLGDVRLSGHRYEYTDSRDNLHHQSSQEANFFMSHPRGRAEFKYASGVTENARLEDLPERSTIATVTFTSDDGNVTKSYRVVSYPSSMTLAFDGEDMPFQLESGWTHHW